MRVHYLADSHKRGEWANKARSGYSSQHAWDQEHEIDFSVMPGKPVWDCTNLIVADQFYDGGLPVKSGMDYSFHANVCLSAQIHRRADGLYSLHVLTTTATFDTYIEPFADEVKRRRAIVFPGCPEFNDYGDYSANQRTSTGTIIEQMNHADLHLVTVPTGPGGVLKGNELVQHLIGFGLMEIDPSNVELIKAVRTGYVFQEGKRDLKGMPIPTQEHPACDYADALRYLVVNTFELQEMPGGGSVVSVKNPFRGSEQEAQPAKLRPPWRATYADDAGAELRDARPVGAFRGGADVSPRSASRPQLRDAGMDDGAFR